MVQYSFDEDRDRDMGWLERGAQATRGVVRLAGFVLMAVGLFIALSVIAEAWSLYHEPQRIEPFAAAVETGSHLDRVVGSVHNEEKKDTETADGAAVVPKPAAPETPSFRLSYFAAWLLAILLLMLIGRLAIAAIRTGGELVLYDLRMKQFAKAIVHELGRGTPR
ncbi:MAG: hypothetical protein HY749_01360 [Gammaproteobacteria bacterium]|nr:hypothetical protein [Gammaproteobacteria bacterium]MBI5617888.1 hypothetical protein [Gammaproteobacteria bacterium]